MNIIHSRLKIEKAPQPRLLFYFQTTFRRVSALFIVQRSFDKRSEQRMAFARIGSELWVELAGEEPRMVRQFDGFDQAFSSGRYAADNQTCLFQRGNVVVVDFVAVAVALADVFAAIDFGGEAACFNSTSCAPKRMVPPNRRIRLGFRRCRRRFAIRQSGRRRGRRI